MRFDIDMSEAEAGYIMLLLVFAFGVYAAIYLN